MAVQSMEETQVEAEAIAVVPVVLIQQTPTGVRASWMDCDLHGAIQMLEIALQGLESQHEQEHQQAAADISDTDKEE